MEKPDRVFKHWFECKLPMLHDLEEEIFFQHPSEEIKCNQIGMLYYNEEHYVAYDMRSGSVVRKYEDWNGKRVRLIGSKLKVIWECYHNQKLEAGAHFLFTNGNPLDLTMENVLAISRLDPHTKQEASKTKVRFIKNSVEHLVKLESKYEKRGIDKDTLHELLQIPNWLLGARSRYSGAIPKALQKYVK